tara:strand:+ start:385 stop:780 length:396 start_codon:yes stop_codon:yes gene_type:complete
MNIKSQITNLYEIIFEEIPDPGTLESLILHYKQNNNSIDAVENYLRGGEKFKKLSVELETELKVAELYYNILERMPDKEGLNFFKNQLLQNTKSLELIKEEFKNSDEFKEKILNEKKFRSNELMDSMDIFK